MQFSQLLRGSHRILGCTGHIYSKIDADKLAKQAVDLELAHGRILNPLHVPLHRQNLFLVNVEPAAPHLIGLRLPGVQARLARALATITPVQPPREGSVWEFAKVAASACIVASLGILLATSGLGLEMVVIGAWVTGFACSLLQMSAWAVLGSGAAPLREATWEAHQHNRRVGHAGYLEARLLERADVARAANKSVIETLWLGVAVGLRLTLLVPRTANLALGAGALMAAASYACVMHGVNGAHFYASWGMRRLAGKPAHIAPMRQFDGQPQALERAFERAFEEALHRPRPRPVPPFLHHRQPHQIGQAEAFARGVNVHDRGRTPRTMASLSRLLLQHPQVDATRALSEVDDLIAQHRRLISGRRLGPGPWPDHPLAQPHRSGAMDTLTAAKAALYGPARGFAFITQPNNRLQLANRASVSLRDVLATVWHAIAALNAPNDDIQATQLLRQERREALILALADCIDDDGAGVCSLGQAQRLLLVLQGSVDCVQIDELDQVHTPTQFVTEQLQRHLGAYTDGPTQAQLFAGLDAAWQQAQRTYPDQARRDQVFALLRDYAQVSDDAVWPPATQAAA